MVRHSRDAESIEFVNSGDEKYPKIVPVYTNDLFNDGGWKLKTVLGGRNRIRITISMPFERTKSFMENWVGDGATVLVSEWKFAGYGTIKDGNSSKGFQVSNQFRLFEPDPLIIILRWILPWHLRSDLCICKVATLKAQNNV